MRNFFQSWAIHTFVSVFIGGAAGFLLLWLWFFCRWIFLGYGDSGPAWISTVNDIVFWGGVLLAIAGGQILFVKNLRKQKPGSP